MFKPNVEKLKSERDVDGLIKALKHKHIFVRSRAVEALGKIGGARAVEPLIQTLNDEAWHVRGAAAAALGEMGDKRAVEPLVQALKDEGELSWHVRERAARALGKIGGERPVGALIHTLKNDEWLNVRRGAIEALGKIGKPAEEPLIRALKNESRDVRLTTAWALGYIGDEEAVKSLVHAQKDEDPSVREAATEALCKIKVRKAENRSIFGDHGMA